MKVYNLCCEHDHRFEGWFSSEQDFNDQLSGEMLACPLCESTNISRRPSAPRLRKSVNAPSAPGQLAPQDVQQQVMALMRKIVARSEDVGERFAHEARRMHYDEVPERPIRGTASRAECEALADEGIDVLPLPSVLKQSLQ